MRNKTVKVLSTILAAAMTVISLAGCGAENAGAVSGESTKAESEAVSGGSTKAADGESSTAVDDDGEKRKVVVYANKSDAENEFTEKVNAAFTEQTGIEVEMKVLAGEAGKDFQKNLDIAMMSGDDGDVIALGNDTEMAKYAESGLLSPLEDLAAQHGDDVEAKYGDYLSNARNGAGQLMGLPRETSIWAVYYNKKIFDEAGVAYPSGEWTWSDYVETAKKLTNTEKGIYGSYMLDYDNYLFGYASQLGVSPYKEDGTSNYDDPAFADALKWFNDLGTVDKIQPSYIEFTTKQLPWDGFMTGNYGMTYISSWYLSQFANTTDYPRDWEFGIVESPTPDGAAEKYNMASTGFYAISQNGKNQEEAYEYIRFQADEAWKINGRIPARADMTDEEWNQVFSESIKKSGDNVTLEDVKKALIDNGMTPVSEKITGSIPAEYSDIILKNGQLYLLGEKSLEDTVKAVKTEADEAIADAEADK